MSAPFLLFPWLFLFLTATCFSKINVPYSHTAETHHLLSLFDSEMLGLELTAKISGEVVSKGHHWKRRVFQDSGFSTVCKIVVCFRMQGPDPVALGVTLLASVGLLRDRDCRLRFCRVFDK